MEAVQLMLKFEASGCVKLLHTLLVKLAVESRCGAEHMWHCVVAAFRRATGASTVPFGLGVASQTVQRVALAGAMYL